MERFNTHSVETTTPTAGAALAAVRPRFALRQPSVLPGFGLSMGFTLLYMTLLLFIPLAGLLLFTAVRMTPAEFWAKAVADPRVLASYRLSFGASLIAATVNGVFGLVVAWVLVRYQFPGKRLVDALVDLPFALPTAVSGIALTTLYAHTGWLGPWLLAHEIRIIFAVPGIVLATMFVTFPFVARELIPLMQAQGSEEEESALTLGASGWQTFWRVTLPNIKWGLLYGVLLTNARAMGEFGAVSVVSGHIRGQTNTMPLHIKVLYNDYQTTAAFALASLLAFLAVVTLGVKSFIEWKIARDHVQAVREAEQGDRL